MRSIRPLVLKLYLTQYLKIFGQIQEPPPQKNRLGLWTSTSLVVGNMIGSGVFLMPAALAAYGGISALGWPLSSIGAFLLAKGFSNLASPCPRPRAGLTPTPAGVSGILQASLLHGVTGYLF